MICTRAERQCWSKQQAGTSAQIAPVVELVGIFGPAVADVRAVVHVGDEDVLDAGIDLGLSLLRGLTGADNDEHNAGSAGSQPLAVHDAVEVDVADVAFLGELGLHFEKRAIEEQVGLAPEHGSAHFPGGWPDFAGEKFLVLEVDVDRRNEFLAVEESADGDFDAVDAALQLKHFDLVGEGFLVGLEHTDYVFAVFFFPNEQAALDVLRFAAGFDDVAVGIFLDELDGGVERIEVFVGNDAYAGGFELFLAEGALVLEALRVGGAADYRFAGSTKGLSLGALAESVIENDDVRPLGVFFPILGIGDEPIGDVALLFGFHVVADVMAFLEHLPGDVTDETGE